MTASAAQEIIDAGDVEGIRQKVAPPAAALLVSAPVAASLAVATPMTVPPVATPPVQMYGEEGVTLGTIIEGISNNTTSKSAKNIRQRAEPPAAKPLATAPSAAAFTAAAPPAAAPPAQPTSF